MSADSLYENIQFLDPDGNLIFRGNAKKRQWYTSRGLVTKIANNVFQFNFYPKGPGHQGVPFFLDERKNECCVCGEDLGQLVKKHLIPLCFYRHLAEEVRNKTKHILYHDILPFCYDCVIEYNDKNQYLIYACFEAAGLKIDNGNLNIEISGTLLGSINEISGPIADSRTLKIRGDKIPEQRKQFLINRIELIKKKCSISDSQWEDLCSIKPPVTMVLLKERLKFNCLTFEEKSKMAIDFWINDIDSINDFFVMFREHFIDTMKPMYLPDNWSPYFLISEHLLKREAAREKPGVLDVEDISG